MRILILKPSSLGDVIHAIPVLRNLRLTYPDAEIDWWVARGLAPLLEKDPDLSQCLLFDRDRWSMPLYWPELLRHIRTLRARRYDLVIDLQALARSATFGWAVNGGTFLGLDDRREGAPLFYDRVIPPPARRIHAVERYLNVVPVLGQRVRWDFEWLPVSAVEREELHDAHPDEGPWVALQPGARWPTKQWPVPAFSRLLHILKARGVTRFVVLGGKEDCEKGAALREEHPDLLDLTGKASLRSMIEWLRRAAVMVTNDTGPMHVAAAVGTRVVAPFGPTDPVRTGPFGQEDRVLQAGISCVPCLKSYCSRPVAMECLDRIAPEQVAQAVEWALAHPTVSCRWQTGKAGDSTGVVA